MIEWSDSVRLWTDSARHVPQSVLLSRRWPRLKFAEKWLRREAIIVRPWSRDHAASDFPFVQHGW